MSCNQKTIKPARAWVVIYADGMLSTVENVACLFPTRKDAERWAMDTESPIRVRIIEDKAVELVIADLRTMVRKLGDRYPGPTARAMIRALGGKV